MVLYGNLNDNKKIKDVGTVDLVIDESNPKNYYIDSEINRLSGNLPQDYFHQTSQNKQSLNNHLDDEIECLTDDDIEFTIWIVLNSHQVWYVNNRFVCKWNVSNRK